MRRILTACLTLVACGGVVAVLVLPAAAVPSYSRRYDIACSTCHTTFGALNAAGINFRLSGYRRINGRDLQPTIKDIDLAMGALSMPSTLPLSIVMATGFDFQSIDRKASDGSKKIRPDVETFSSTPKSRPSRSRRSGGTACSPTASRPPTA